MLYLHSPSSLMLPGYRFQQQHEYIGMTKLSEYTLWISTMHLTPGCYWKDELLQCDTKHISPAYKEYCVPLLVQCRTVQQFSSGINCIGCTCNILNIWSFNQACFVDHVWMYCHLILHQLLHWLYQ